MLFPSHSVLILHDIYNDASLSINNGINRTSDIDWQRIIVSVSEIKSEHSDDAIRRELESEEYARWPERPVGSARPCLKRDEF